MEENILNSDFVIDKNKNLIISNENIEIDFTKLSIEITKIILKCNYKFPLNNLPLHIESLILDYNYNIELKNLPCNLKQLVLGIKYNKPLYYLPESLEILEIGTSYSFDLLHLPKNIKKLCLSSYFYDYLNFDLPYLLILDLKYSNFMYSNTVNIKCINNLQNCLKELYLSSLFSYSLHSRRRYILEEDTLADTLADTLEFKKFIALEILSIGASDKYIKNFPINLKKLILDYGYNHPLDNLPKNLEYLELGDYFNNNLNNLPNTLKVLDLNNNKVCNVLINYPESLDTIHIIETHPQTELLCKHIKNKHLDIKIILKPDWDKREQDIDDFREQIW